MKDKASQEPQRAIVFEYSLTVNRNDFTPKLIATLDAVAKATRKAFRKAVKKAQDRHNKVKIRLADKPYTQEPVIFDVDAHRAEALLLSLSQAVEAHTSSVPRKQASTDAQHSTSKPKTLKAKTP